jgi:hypothetical protein
MDTGGGRPRQLLLLFRRRAATPDSVPVGQTLLRPPQPGASAAPAGCQMWNAKSRLIVCGRGIRDDWGESRRDYCGAGTINITRRPAAASVLWMGVYLTESSVRWRFAFWCVSNHFYAKRRSSTNPFVSGSLRLTIWGPCSGRPESPSTLAFPSSSSDLEGLCPLCLYRPRHQFGRFGPLGDVRYRHGNQARRTGSPVTTGN